MIEQEKVKKSKGRQKTLTNFLANEGNSKIMNTKQILQRQLQKLQKIRKDIYKKKIEQNKIINKILKLQLEDKQELNIVEQDQNHEEYWIFTEEQAIDTCTNNHVNFFKLILGDYGRPITNLQPHSTNNQTIKKDYPQQSEYNQDKRDEQQTQIKTCDIANQIEVQTQNVKDQGQFNKGQIQLQIKQWKQNGLIKSQYLVGYQGQFLHYLKSMQYVADQIHSSNPFK